MIPVELKPGDVFASSNPQFLGWMINFVQTIQSDDCNSTYGHCGIITSAIGETFEALWTIKPGNLDAYKGKQILVARWTGMDEEKFKRGMSEIIGQSGQWYPFGRLFLYLLGMPKIHRNNNEVCSELTTHFLIKAGATMRSGKNWYGVSPDELVDEWRISRYFDIIYEGVCGEP